MFSVILCFRYCTAGLSLRDFFNLLDWPVLPPDLSSGTEGLNLCNGHLLSVCFSLISSAVLGFVPPRELRCHEDAALFRAPLSGRSRLQILPSEREGSETESGEVRPESNQAGPARPFPVLPEFSARSLPRLALSLGLSVPRSEPANLLSILSLPVPHF